MSDHTPGPWKHQCEVETMPDEFGGRRVPRYEIYNESGPFAHIATANKGANARLIAAAPEMYDAIRAYLDAAFDDVATTEAINEFGRIFVKLNDEEENSGTLTPGKDTR